MNTPVVDRRIFSVERANSMLPLLRAIVSDIVEVNGRLSPRFRTLREINDASTLRADEQEDSMYSEEMEDVRRQLAEDAELMQKYQSELRDLGVECVDSQRGRIGFATRINGKPAHLSWELGEDHVGFWTDDEDQDLRYPVLDANRIGMSGEQN